MKERTIIIEKHYDHFVAHLGGVIPASASGGTPGEAVGNLIRTHPEHFGIKVVEGF